MANVLFKVKNDVLGFGVVYTFFDDGTTISQGDTRPRPWRVEDGKMLTFNEGKWESDPPVCYQAYEEWLLKQVVDG